MSEPTEQRLTIVDLHDAGGDYHHLTAILKVSGDLVLEGQDLGAGVKSVFGDSDFEYWRTVKAEHVPQVLLHLLKDRFQTDFEFKRWLEEKGIPSEFTCF